MNCLLDFIYNIQIVNYRALIIAKPCYAKTFTNYGDSTTLHYPLKEAGKLQ
jgi:hypothetical protein